MRTLERVVLTWCPETDVLVTTGVAVASLDDLEPTNRLVECAACGSAHEWTPAEAVLAET